MLAGITLPQNMSQSKEVLLNGAKKKKKKKKKKKYQNFFIITVLRMEFQIKLPKQFFR